MKHNTQPICHVKIVVLFLSKNSGLIYTIILMSDAVAHWGGEGLGIETYPYLRKLKKT